jgi:hypothetical protein
VSLDDGKTRRGRKLLLRGLKEKRGYWKLKEKHARSHSVENSCLKRLWTCRKTDYVRNGCLNNVVVSHTKQL